MKLRSIFAGALLFALSLTPSLAQVNPGTSQLSPAKGGAPSISATAFPYNVKCDGSNNDTAGIAAALAGANGKVLSFPSGVCLTDPQLSSGSPVFSGAFTSGSAVVTGLATTTNMAVGQTVSGYTTTQAATISTGTTVVLNAFTSTANLSTGMSVTGGGCPGNTTISTIDTVAQFHTNNSCSNGAATLTIVNTSIPTTAIKTVDSATQVTLNANATASGTQQIQFTFNNVPRAILAFGTTFKARAASALPTFTLENPHVLINDAAIYGAIFDANSLHGYPFKVHGGQFFQLYDVQTLNGATGGAWFAAEAGYGIYSSKVDIRARGNAGAGVIAKSTNNQGNYLIGADRWLIDSQNNGSYGLDADYASIALKPGSLLQGNTTCGANLDHVIQYDSFGVHYEANPTNPGCAITATANSLNGKIEGGRFIGSNTSSLLTQPSWFFNTSGADPTIPLIYMGGVHFTATGPSIPSGFGLAFGGTSANDTSINSPASGLSFQTTGNQKWSYQNGIQVGAPTGGDKGNGTINITGNGADNFDINGTPYAAFTKTFTNTTFDSGGTGNSLQVGGVAVSKGQFPGTATNDNAAAGNIGEFNSSTIALASAVTLSTGVTSNLTSASLAAGDYEVMCGPLFLPGATTNATFLDVGLTTTSATLPTVDGLTTTQWSNSAGQVLGSTSLSIPAAVGRFSLSTTTTVFCVAQATFTVSTMKVFGMMRWRRVR